MPSAEFVGLILSYAASAIFWAWMWLHIISKIGYRGLSRKLWLIGMCIPPVLPGVMIALLLLPWPVHQELRKLKKAIPEIKAEFERMSKLPPRN